MTATSTDVLAALADPPGAGQLLDSLVAQHVMGIDTRAKGEYLVPPFSTDIAAAWQIMRHFESRWYSAGVEICGDLGWRAAIGASVGVGETVEEAICMAALKTATQKTKEV